MPPDTVKLSCTVIVPVGAVKVPLDKVNDPSKFTVVYAPRFKVVALVVNGETSATVKPLNPDKTAVAPKEMV